jgi:5'-nucleotidase
LLTISYQEKYIMKRTLLTILLLFTLLLALTSLVSAAPLQGEGKPNPPGNPDPSGQLIDLQLLAFNDYHGHLQANTPGTVDGEAAGGSEYLSTKLSELRQGHKYSLTVAAGDLIGGSPAFSGLFHDEPSVESLNAMQLDISGVGNHEFDEGVTELLRMQYGGCTPWTVATFRTNRTPAPTSIGCPPTSSTRPAARRPFRLTRSSASTMSASPLSA